MKKEPDIYGEIALMHDEDDLKDTEAPPIKKDKSVTISSHEIESVKDDNSKEYIVKTIRLHKNDDKDLIDILDTFSRKRKFSDKVKEVLKEFFKLTKRKDEEILSIVKDIKSKLDNGIASQSSSVVSMSAPTIIREQGKSIAEFMGESIENAGDEDLF